MARPQKEGLDYFPLDCQFSDSVRLLQAEFGPMGVGILIALWQRIYGIKGYYTVWDNDVALMFAKENGVSVSVVREVISACLRRGIFDRDKFEKYSILTSCGIQERYAEATERRTFQKIDGRYLLVSAPENWVIVDNNSVNADINAVNVCRSTQSKGKESTVYKRTVKDSEILLSLPFSDGMFAVSSVLADKYKKDYPNIDVISVLNDISDWLNKNSHTKPLSDAHQFICGWLKGENQKAQLNVEPRLTERSHEVEDFFNAAVAKSMGADIGDL